MKVDRRKTRSDNKNRKARPPREKNDNAMMQMRSNRYQMPAGTKIEYKNISLLQRYVTDRGKIVSRRISGVSAKKQRELQTAIKRARFLSLITIGVRKKY